jgi:hypothetical protein
MVKGVTVGGSVGVSVGVAAGAGVGELIEAPPDGVAPGTEVGAGGVPQANSNRISKAAMSSLAERRRRIAGSSPFWTQTVTSLVKTLQVEVGTQAPVEFAQRGGR